MYIISVEREVLQLLIRTTDGKIAALREARGAGKISLAEYQRQRDNVIAVRQAAHRRLMKIS